MNALISLTTNIFEYLKFKHFGKLDFKKSIHATE